VRTNRLIDESSPYLLQHARNPVDWYPWGEEALARAREEDKPIFLSIGYAACHWCHVMEHESFEDEGVADFLNRHFICIKVDREERPDLDDIYMTAVQMLTGAGGWPMTVFLTPDLKPFFGGTYFPPDDRYGRPGFKNLLSRMVDIWANRRADVLKSADEIANGLMGRSMPKRAPGAIGEDLIENAVRELERSHDVQWGGFGGAPKFPPSGSLALLLRHYRHTGEQRALDVACHTLDRMASGGLYDQLGGGFHRYSVDERWLVPHFEKMLYDNALLSQVYLEAYQVTGRSSYRRIARETLEYAARDMRDEAGGLHSSEDADSEGVEGKFYVWTPDEIEEVLGKEDAELFCGYYGVTSGGNFEGKNILHVPQADEAQAKKRGLEVEALRSRLAGMREKLLAKRAGRVRPGKDDKVLTSWNGLMISAFARGAQVLEEKRFGRIAAEAAAFVLGHMMRNGQLLRSYRKGKTRQPGFLDDYAFFATALLDLYETSFESKWLEAAASVADQLVEAFWDEEEGSFYFTSQAHHDILTRVKPTFDGAEPSGNAMSTLLLFRLARYLDRADYRDKAERVLAHYASMLREAPRAFMNMLCAVDYCLRPDHEIAIVGSPDDRATHDLLAVVYARFLPNRILALLEPDGAGEGGVAPLIPLLQGKRMVNGRPTAYVCRNFACQEPVTSADELERVLAE